MKNIQRCIVCCMMLLMTIACKKEDGITPEAVVPNPFYPDVSATDEHAQLCRNFYAETGCYLLLNDTLKHEYLGVDRYGNPLYSTELIDLTYSVTSSVQWKFEFNYSTNYQRELRAVEILKNDILPSMDERYYPYSFLLVESYCDYAYMIEEGDNIGYRSGPDSGEYYIGNRATVIAIGSLLKDKKALIKNLLRNLLEKQLTNSVLKDFYAPGLSYYSKDWMGEFTSLDDFYNRTGILAVKELLFVGDEAWTYCVESNTADLKKFLNPLLEGKEEAFRAEYATYPIILEKFEILKQVIIDLGFSIH